MTDINLNDLSVDELQALKRNIDGAMERKQLGELLEVRNAVDALVDNSPFTLEEILEAKKPRKPVAAKYQNPNDASQAWTGRGRKPIWVVNYINDGGMLEELAI